MKALRTRRHESAIETESTLPLGAGDRWRPALRTLAPRTPAVKARGATVRSSLAEHARTQAMRPFPPQVPARAHQQPLPCAPGAREASPASLAESRHRHLRQAPSRSTQPCARSAGARSTRRDRSRTPLAFPGTAAGSAPRTTLPSRLCAQLRPRRERRLLPIRGVRLPVRDELPRVSTHRPRLPPAADPTQANPADQQGRIENDTRERTLWVVRLEGRRNGACSHEGQPRHRGHPAHHLDSSRLGEKPVPEPGPSVGGSASRAP